MNNAIQLPFMKPKKWRLLFETRARSDNAVCAISK